MSNPSDTFTLRQARKIETRLQAYIDKSVDAHVYFNMHAEDAGIELYNEAVNDLQSSIFDLVRAIDLRFEIRRKIQIANEAKGINDRISQREALLRRISFFTRLLGGANKQKIPAVTDATIKGRLETMKKNAVANVYGSSADDVVAFSTVTPEVRENIEKTVADAKNTVGRIDEELLTKNVTVRIELAARDVEFLRDLDFLP